ncbi:ATP-dependent DNA helicase RecG [Pseudomonas linyingensis]|uniref:ATP-dependent DNA helicase RecG n=1 Tax=Pseudomonas linyingensis TaxID=915471 RepID=A0A1H7A4T3_9PSED|nr:ATP-binding protein [Pseudomonas linyingensis]SEJ60591.1 ATP-dependent DNA helicase RecG [Pseudomonas linyingensis]
MKDQPDLEWKDLPAASPGATTDRFLHPDAGGSWDDLPMPQVQLADLDPQALADFRQRAAASQRLSCAAVEEGDAALVEQLQLFHLKRAAALLFHAEPEKLVSGAYIRIGHFRRDNGLVEQHAIGGNLFVQLERSLALLEEHLQRDPDGGEARAPAAYPLPIAALREALINAIVHKDYASGIPIQIRLHDDRISLWNPARLPEGWSIASLRTRHLSRPGNPDIANAFYRAGLIEAWGLGIDKLIAACRAHGIVEPLLRHEQDGLWLEFAFTRALPRHFAAGPASRGAGRATGEAKSEATGEAAGHAAGEDAGEVAGHVAGRSTSHVAGHVTGEVRRLVQACDGVMSRKALQDALGLRSDANFRTLYLVPALEAGLLEMTIPDKPKSSRQQYRLSATGAALRQRAPA